MGKKKVAKIAKKVVKAVVRSQEKKKKFKPSKKTNVSMSSTKRMLPKRTMQAISTAAFGKKSRGSSLSNKIAYGICIPGSVPNLRMKPTVGDSRPTGVVALHSLTTQKQPTNAGTYNSMPIGTSFCALFRDPFRAMIVFTPNTAAAQYTYVGQFRTSVNVLNPYFVFANIAQAEEVPLNMVYLKASTAFAPHGSYLFPGSFDDDRYVWLDLGASITVVQSVADTGGRLSLFAWDGSAVQFAVGLFNTTTVTVTNTFATGSYVSMQYSSQTNPPTNTNLTVSFGGTGDVFAHLAVPNVINHLQQLTAVRMNAASIMMTPVAAALNRGGTITGGDLEANALWYNYTNTNAITSLPSGNFSEKDFMVGMYSFLKPGSIDDFAVRNNCTVDSGIPTQCYWNLTDKARYNVFVLNSDVTGAVSPGLEFLLTCYWDLEFQTSDEWFETHLPTGSHYDTIDALELCERVPVFHDNPLHFSDVKAALSGGYNFIRKHSSKIAGAIGTMFPFLAGPARAGAKFLHSLPEA
jgi:hypothetical protein